MRAAGEGGSVARDTQAGVQGSGGRFTLANAYVALTMTASVAVLAVALVGARGPEKQDAASLSAASVSLPHAANEAAPLGVVVTVGPDAHGGVAGERTANTVTTTNTPTPPRLGNAGLAADYDGSQRVVPAALWSAIVAEFPAHEHANALHIARIESHYDCMAVNATSGARGCWQVMERFHGPVSNNVSEQARQAAGIVRAHGWSPWAGE